MTDTDVKSGTCRACGRPLVQAEGRTYHPAVNYSEGAGIPRCPALLLIAGTEHFPNGPAYSLDVPESQFIEQKEQSMTDSWDAASEEAEERREAERERTAFYERLARIRDNIELTMDCQALLLQDPDVFDHTGRAIQRYYFQIMCYRRDVITGEMGYGYGGKAYVEPEQSEDQIVAAIFGLFKAYWEHEAREGFQYQGRRVYGPHTKLSALMEASRHVNIPSATHVGDIPRQEDFDPELERERRSRLIEGYEDDSWAGVPE